MASRLRVRLRFACGSPDGRSDRLQVHRELAGRLKPALESLGFDQFIGLPQHRREVEKWETAGTTGKKWRLWRWVPLFIGAALGLFLLSTQEELRMTLTQLEGVGAVVVSIITALSIAIPRLRRVASGQGAS